MLAVLACALLLRIIIPSGWMPVADVDGLRITICTGMGPVDVPVSAIPIAPMAMPVPMSEAAASAMHHAPGGSDHQAADHPCVFSGLGLALAEPVLPALDLPKAVMRATFAPAALLVAIGRGLAAPPPPATGPPLHA